MAEYPPPKEIDAIFNPLNFYDTDTSGIGGGGGGGGGGSYLNYPVAQGTETLQTTNINGLLTVNDDEIVNGQVTINGPGGLNTYTGSIITNGTMYSQNHPGSILWQFTDVTNATIGTFKVNNNNFYIYSGGNNGTQNFQVKDTGGTIQTPLELNYTTTTVNTVNPLTYGPANVQPASTDSSTKIPSTAWVQSAISSIPASVPIVSAVAQGMLSTFNGFSFTYAPYQVSSNYQNYYFTMRVTVSMDYGSTNPLTTPMTTNSSFTGVINIYPYWLQQAYNYQNSFTQFPSNTGNPNNVFLTGMYLGFDPVGNRYLYPINGTTTGAFPPGPNPPQWVTVTGVTTPGAGGSNLDITTISNTYSYPSTPATWMANRWAYTVSSTASNMYAAGSSAPYFQLLPVYYTTLNLFGVKLMIYNPAGFTGTFGANSYYDATMTCEIIDKGIYTFGNYADRGNGQWSHVTSAF